MHIVYHCVLSASVLLLSCWSLNQCMYTTYVYAHMAEGQYKDAVETLDGERERWEHEMTQYAKVCRTWYSLYSLFWLGGL